MNGNRQEHLGTSAPSRTARKTQMDAQNEVTDVSIVLWARWGPGERE